MSDRVLTAEARITATDATGAVFANIGRKIDALGKSAKISPQVDSMVKSLERAERQMKALDAVQSQRGSFSAARTKFADTQKAVESAARAMKSAEAPSRQLTAGYERAQKAVSAASAAFERQRAVMTSAIRTAESFGAPIGKIAAEQTRLKGVISSTTAAIEKQMIVERKAAQVQEQRGRAMRTAGTGGRGGHGDGTLAGLAGMYVSHEVGHLARSVVERYGEFDRERRYGKVVMGLSDAEQEPLIRQAIRGGASTRFNDIAWLESQRELAARGYNRDQVMAFTPIAAQLGQAFDVSMPEGVKGLEGGLLGFRKDTSSYGAAMASAQRTADLQVKAGKISGMGFEDIVALYKYAAAPAQMARLSEESMLAFGAISKKSNMGGDESGVAFRALAKNLITPTAGAQLAMRAAGINFNSFQKMPDSLDTQGFVDTVAKNFGVKLDSKAQGALGAIFTNKALIGNATAFMPAVRGVLGDVLGGDDARSKGKIAGLARNYRDASVQSVDTNALMTSLMTAMAKSPALANAVFGSKQGGRIFSALGDPGFYSHILDELQHKSQGFAGTVSGARTEGFAGAVQRLQGSLANVETAIGRSLDNGGKGGLLTHGTEGIAAALNAFTEAGPAVHQLAAAGGVAAGAWGSMKGLQLLTGGFGLKGSALALDHAAGHLEVAAARLGGGSGLPGGGGAPGGHGPGRSPSSKSLVPRALGMLVTGAPMLMSAYDDVTNPQGRQARYEEQAKQAQVDRQWWGNKVRKLRDKLGLTKLLPFSDDQQGPGLPSPMLEEDPILRRFRQSRFFHRPPAFVPGVHILEGIDDPWLGGERQAIERRSLIAADHFRRDPEAARGDAMMRSQGPLDITGKVAADVNVQGKTVVVVEPSPLLLARIAFQSQINSAQPSVGVTGAGAGKAPHVGRGDL